jgi:hypothetical protein
MGPPAALGHVGPVILDRPTVRGHPATVWRDTSKNVTCLTWSESATVAFQVCDRRYPKPVLDAATLVQVANSLH